MSSHIKKLYEISQKQHRLIIGLMAGTSLDGLDIALCKFTGAAEHTEVSVLAFETVSFTESQKEPIRRVFAKKEVDFQHLCMLNPWIGNLHSQMILECLAKWQIDPNTIDAVASHGQTVMHMPARLHGVPDMPNATLQIGDGDHIAVKTGIITLSDFRQKHCAVGGEGAPLALYGDYLIFGSLTENRILINMGGIANFTYLPMSMNFDEGFATDTGPGNTLLDAYVQKHFQLPFDKDATLALQGACNEALLAALKNHPFFKESIPKTTGPELFNLAYLDNCLNSLNQKVSKVDVLHTLCKFTADTLADEILKSVRIMANTVAYVSGGGAHNPLILSYLSENIPHIPVKNLNVLGIDPDAKEAVLFAALANETLAGDAGFQKPNHQEGRFFMGKISFPA